MTSAHPRAGLYIHVPFCSSVCPYCDFAVTIAGEERRREWIEAVIAEARSSAQHDLAFDTVYIGGGTPSVLGAEQLSAVVEGVRRELPIAADAWLHLEVNPEHVTPESVASWRRLGVRFLSLGVQSFDDDTLRILGRTHRSAGARAAVERALDGGFHTVSLDLIYGVPGRPPDTWRSDLEAAVSLGVHHLSCYQLTFHDHTVFGKRLRAGQLDELPEAAQAELFFATFEILSGAGLAPYEVSSFAAGAEHRSRHNQKYWHRTPYLGLGPSAHSYAGGRRWWNQRKLRLWRAAIAAGRSPIVGEETLSRDEQLLEALLLGLRTVEGVDLRALESTFGVELVAANAAMLERMVADGHVEWNGTTVRPTVSGLAIADTVARAIQLPP